ncbi:hypothetical protein T439DRAFT_319910 [Meredithblackwellia eburnea MCA 4105]
MASILPRSRGTALRIFSTKTIAYSTSAATKTQVDSLCIPAQPPYSLRALLPDPTPLPRETLLKLHKLSALDPPTTEEGWRELDDLGGLVAIMEGVRSFGRDLNKSTGQGREEELVIVDARVREEEGEILTKPVEKGESGILSGSLLDLAQVKEGAYFTVRTPEGIRGKVRAKGNKRSIEEEEYYHSK